MPSDSITGPARTSSVLPLLWLLLASCWLMLGVAADRPALPVATRIVSVVGPMIGVQTP